jgi:hypothetical protein
LQIYGNRTLYRRISAELMVKASWLNQFGHVIVGHGISLLGWRSGGFMHPHDMPPFRILAVTNFRR